ncbi:MAG: GNAT family N-acetyltransferase [Ilumatobacteraceae bacterium]
MFTETEAIAALETNIWSMMAQFGRVDPGRLIETPTRLVLETDVSRPPYNTVLRFYDEGDRSIDAQVHELVARFDRRDCTPAWLLHPTTPSGVRESLDAHGWVCAEAVPGMIHTLDDLVPLPDARSDIEVVEAGVGHGAAWLDLVSTRYGLDESDSPYLRQVFDRVIGTGVRVWIASHDGVPVSKVGVHGSGDVAGIYGVATTEQGRGKGLGSLLTNVALQATAAAGFSASVLHSTPMAHSMYQRLGYRDVATFEIWARPNEVHL